MVDNAGAELDEIGIQLEPIPKIFIQQPSIDLTQVQPDVSPRDDPPPPRPISAAAPEIPPLPEISTTTPEIVNTPSHYPNSVMVIAQRPGARLEKTVRRKIVNKFLSFSSHLGLGAARHAHRLVLGGFRAERVRGVACVRKRVGPENQYPLRIYIPEQGDGGEMRPAIFYIHGNLPFANARSYHSFTANLSLETSAVLIAFDFQPVPERHFALILDDCVNLLEQILTGLFDSDFETIGLAIDHEKIVLAGDSAGALLAFAVALELAHQHDFDRPDLHGLLLISPPLQALTTQMFESHVKFADINPVLSHRLDECLPLYAGLKARNELQQARSAVRAERHVATDLRSRLLRRIFPTYNVSGSSSGDGANDEPVGIFHEISQLSASIRIWPMLMKNRELALLPVTMMQACENDTLFDEERLFAKRLSKVQGYRFHFSVIPNSAHNESVHFRLLKTKSSLNGFRELVDFLKETLEKPPVTSRREDTVTVGANQSPRENTPPASLPECIE